MEEHRTNYCGDLLLRWRKQRKLSRLVVATAAGLSPSTISNWESGRFLPRLPELLLLLNYLGVPAVLQQEAVRQLQRPRSLQWLQRETKNDAFVQIMGLPPSPHDLIRCLRLRANKTIDETARQLGVTRRTLMRWESGDSWPDTVAMHSLCYTLCAHPQEMLALTQRELNVSGVSGTQKPLGTMRLEELEEVFWTFRKPPQPPERIALTELTYLSLAHAVWPYARCSEAGRELLFNIYADLGNYHSLAGRPRVAQVFLNRALAFLKETWTESSHFRDLTSLVIARASAVQKTPEASRQLVAAYLPLVEKQPDHHGWMLANIATYYRNEGNLAASDDFSLRSLSVAEQGGWDDLKMRYLDRAWWLIEVGRPHEAFSFLPSISSGDDPTVPLAWARAAAANGDFNDAHTYYQRASELAIARSRHRADVASFIHRLMEDSLRFMERHERRKQRSKYS